MVNIFAHNKRRKNTKSYKYVDGLPMGNTPPRLGGQFKFVNEIVECPP
jgi:hypothetical protein